MTPEQLALAQLDINKLQLWITAAAIFLGPISGVIFTFWFQNRQEIKKQKYSLFLTLLSERKSLTISTQKAAALNIIDIIFKDSPPVVDSWHKYYKTLCTEHSQEREHAWLDLLSLMASDIGYKSLKQTTLDKFYIPQAHLDSLESQNETQRELLRVLKSSHSFGFPQENNIFNPDTQRIL